ncbi:hypothetical protein [Candidatus Protochlamydia phocaeensis]|uniref:hypothetical protein n=1 Tax=Candidatus Protochlamydia phocaeensis TaxID=1414722 RepID=UPI000838BAE6|nr:hypothetical protein [Candidatus Protochlamydia phocaeensis]
MSTDDPVPEDFNLRPDQAVLANELFNNANTNMLIFHFQPHPFPAIKEKLQESSVQHAAIEERDIYILDDFFAYQTSQDLRTFTEQAEFSKRTFASYTSREGGEEPARAMDKRERWNFFTNPPQAIQEVYQLLGLFAYSIGADIATQPWNICYEDACLSAVATNRLESVSSDTMTKGKHDDYCPEEGIPFEIPILYPSEKSYHPTQFINGSPGRPWLVTLMVYVAEENFKPEYGMGTIFCQSNGEIALREECRHMRMVLFEGNIVHGIEESRIPPDRKTWRVSYVYKLTFNPKQEGQSVKKDFYHYMQSFRLKA